MTSETTKLKAKLSNLSSCLDDLEAQLEPLFAQTLPETIVGLETIQQAKLQTVLPYLVYDLIFIYLKSRGIDPKTHPVVPELDRVRQYFEKITNAESPAQKRTAVDKAAAGRFIKHAITQAKAVKTPGDTNSNAQDAASTSSTVVQVKMTDKMIARAQYEKELKELDEEGSEEDEGLEVFEGEGEMVVDEDEDVILVDEDPKGKGKAKESGKGTGKSKQDAITIDEPPQAGSKRRRPVIDPFAGYGDDLPNVNDGSTAKKAKPQAIGGDSEVIDVDALESNSGGQSTPAPADLVSTRSGARVAKKAKKKAKKRASTT